MKPSKTALADGAASRRCGGNGLHRSVAAARICVMCQWALLGSGGGVSGVPGSWGRARPRTAIANGREFQLKYGHVQVQFTILK